jgi:hypothetical protein
MTANLPRLSKAACPVSAPFSSFRKAQTSGRLLQNDWTSLARRALVWSSPARLRACLSDGGRRRCKPETGDNHVQEDLEPGANEDHGFAMEASRQEPARANKKVPMAGLASAPRAGQSPC